MKLRSIFSKSDIQLTKKTQIMPAFPDRLFFKMSIHTAINLHGMTAGQYKPNIKV